MGRIAGVLLSGLLLGAGVVQLAPAPAGATELGGNYNQYVCDVYNGLVVRSGVRWIRAFVNIPRNFLAYDDPADPNRVTGVQNLGQARDPVSGASEQLGIQTATKLRQLKRTGSRRAAPAVVLNLKLDFKYVPDPGAPIPVDQIPAPGTPEYGAWRTAVAQLLTAPGLDVGPAVDVLVLGNEPMFEVPSDPASAARYRTFLHALIDDVAAIRAASGQDYEIFLGALDRPSRAPTDPILEAVVDEVNGNPIVDGLDLHLHEDAVADVRTDLDFVRTTAHVTKALSVTEFSLVGLWNAHADDRLGAWGTQHGYPADLTLAAWLDLAMVRASDGDPIPSADLAGYFESQAWYPDGWFDAFMTEFVAHGVTLATYGLSAPPAVEDLPFACAPSGRIPLVDGKLQPGAYLWVVDFVYNGALLGMADDGFYAVNPLVGPDFARWLGGRPALARAPTFTG